MNILWIFKVLRIVVSKTNPELSWIVEVNFRQEFIEVGYRKVSKLSVVTIYNGNDSRYSISKMT